MHINYLPLNKEKLDTFNLNALHKIAKAKEISRLEEENNRFKKWLLYEDNLFKVKYFINKLEETLSIQNRRIVNKKGFKDMIASILYHNSR